jgi:hypothetical protein
MFRFIKNDSLDGITAFLCDSLYVFSDGWFKTPLRFRALAVGLRRIPFYSRSEGKLCHCGIAG